ncbi:hypothetical protein [Nostoc sp.]
MRNLCFITAGQTLFSLEERYIEKSVQPTYGNSFAKRKTDFLAALLHFD